MFTLTDHKRYLLIAVIAVLLYTAFMSISLDDFDSYLFAFAIERWDNALNEVHAPGFPVYLALGRVLYLALGDTRIALTVLSALSGALTVVCVAWIGAGLGQRRAGMIASLLLLVMPGIWLHSEYALSDMPGLALTLAAVGCLLRGHQRRAMLIMGGFLAGLSLGLRPHNALPLLWAGGWLLWMLRPFTRRQLSTLGLGVAAGLLGIALWLIPVYQFFGGFDGYLDRLNAHSQHIQQADSLFGQGITGATLATRLDHYLRSWAQLLSGGGWLPLIGLCFLLLPALPGIPFRGRSALFLWLWFLSSAGKVFLLASLERTRLFLPALIPLVLLLAIGYSRGRWQCRRWTVVAVVSVLLWRSVPLVARLTQEAAPPAQAIHYLHAHYPLAADNTVLLAQGSFMATQYHLGNLHQLYTPYFIRDDWSQDVATRQPAYIVVFDGDEIAPQILDATVHNHDYVSIDDRVFERDRRVFPQHVTVRLQVFIPRANLRPAQLTLPLEGTIHVNDPLQSKYFGDGWYRIEQLGPVPGRWTNQVAMMRVALPSQAMRLHFSATPYMGGQVVTIVVNGQTIAELALNVVWGDYAIDIPASAIADQPISTIEFRHRLAQFPDGHYRQLAAGYSVIRFQMTDE